MTITMLEGARWIEPAARKLFIAIAVFAAVSSSSVAQPANANLPLKDPAGQSKATNACAQLAGDRISGLSKHLVDVQDLGTTKIARHIEPLKTAYLRISEKAKTRPALIVCNSDELNASAVGDSREGVIIFHLPMLEMLDANLNEIAAVMAHEFSHLLLDHSMLKKGVKSNVDKWAKAVALDRYKQTGNVDEAVATAISLRDLGFAKFSREFEQDADDKGFSLAVTLAKFDGEGFKSVARKFQKLPLSGRPTYLATHPSYASRLDKAAILNNNQQYLDEAQRLFSKGNWRALSPLVTRWLNEIPSSGAAWYFKGRVLSQNRKSASEISRSFEEAAALYLNNPTLGTLSQEDQAEAGHAWFNLCVALFDEGYKYESTHCMLRISDGKRQEKFLARTFKALVLVGGTESSSENMFVVENWNGNKLFTDDASVAASRGAYRNVSPDWRAIRTDSCKGKRCETSHLDQSLAVRPPEDDPFRDIRANCKPPNCRIGY